MELEDSLKINTMETQQCLSMDNFASQRFWSQVCFLFLCKGKFNT